MFRTRLVPLLLVAAWLVPGRAASSADKKATLSRPRGLPTVTGSVECAAVRNLFCGQTVDSTTVGLGSRIVAYGCVGYDESGGEVIYRVTLSAQTEVQVALAGMREDLDLFLLGDCDPGRCLGASTGVASEQISVCLPAGTYYVVVDGFAGASSAFTLTLDCRPCSPCTPAAPNDTCADALLVSSRSPLLTLVGSTCCAADDYSDGSCTGYSSLGKDVVYQIAMAPGCRIEVTLRDGPDGRSLDRSVYLVTSCSDPRGSCVAGSDRGITEAESFSYQSNAGGTYYLIVDSFENETCGDYELEVRQTNCAVVDVERRAWQQIKSLYR